MQWSKHFFLPVHAVFIFFLLVCYFHGKKGLVPSTPLTSLHLPLEYDGTDILGKTLLPCQQYWNKEWGFIIVKLRSTVSQQWWWKHKVQSQSDGPEQHETNASKWTCGGTECRTGKQVFTDESLLIYTISICYFVSLLLEQTSANHAIRCLHA